MKELYCVYCKESIEEDSDFVFVKGKNYHLKCYHLILDIPFELDEEDIEDAF